jgi:protein-tyrosine-phosphatase
LNNTPKRNSQTVRQLLFVCVRNRVRSAFSEIYFNRLLSQCDAGLAEQVTVGSAGFRHRDMNKLLDDRIIPTPDPFYDQDLSWATRQALSQKGIATPALWRSKALTPQMIATADLVITALPHQKDELIEMYPREASKFITMREISNWDENLVNEDIIGLPLDENFWYECEENSAYARKTLAETEEMLLRAFPVILEKLGLVSQAGGC